MFDYIAAKDGNDQFKRARLYAGPSDGEMVVMAQIVDNREQSHRTVMTRFCPALSVVTAQWCKDFAKESSELTEQDIGRVEVRTDGKMAVYWCEADCLRIYKGTIDNQICVYERRGNLVCRDSVALGDSEALNPHSNPLWWESSIKAAWSKLTSLHAEQPEQH